MIDTKTYQLTKKTYLNIFFSTLLRNVAQLIPFLIVWSILFSWKSSRSIALYGTCILILVGFCMVLWFFIKNLKPFFTETQVQFDKDHLHLLKKDNNLKLSYEHIRNVVTNKDHWLIYLSINRYIYVPKDIFYTDEDLKKFKSYLNV